MDGDEDEDYVHMFLSTRCSIAFKMSKMSSNRHRWLIAYGLETALGKAEINLTRHENKIARDHEHLIELERQSATGADAINFRGTYPCSHAYRMHVDI